MVWLRNKKTGGLFNTDNIGKINKEEYDEYEKAKIFGFESDYDIKKWEELENKYKKIFIEKQDKEWYLKVKDDPAWEDRVKDTNKFKKLEKQYSKEYNEYAKKRYNKYLDFNIKYINALEKDKENKRSD